jgi:hypothetical protein
MQTKYENPLDTLFGTEPAPFDDDTEYTSIKESDLAVVPGEVKKDAEDIETDAKIDSIYEAAMNAYESQAAMIEIMEPRYAARNSEVAANFLNIALAAATSKAKLAAFIPGGSKVTNNNIVATREEILRMISVDAEVKPF